MPTDWPNTVGNLVPKHGLEALRDVLALHAVVVEFGQENLADQLFADIPDSISFRQVARLFDFIAWPTDDNGSAMTRTVERWLVEGTDLRKIQIALNLEV